MTNRITIAPSVRCKITENNRLTDKGGLWTPDEINPILWYDFSDTSTITLGVSGISQLDDKSNNNYNLVQAIGSDQPLNSEELNGLKVGSFDGYGDHLLNNYDIDERYNNATFLIMLKPSIVNLEKADCVFSMKAGGADWELSSDTINWEGEFRPSTYGNMEYLSYSVDWQIMEWSQSVLNRSAEIYLNGLQIQAENNIGTIGWDLTDVSIRIAMDRDAYTFLTCQVAEILMISNQSGNRIKAEGYLAHKWGRTDLLPFNHKYKTTRP